LLELPPEEGWLAKESSGESVRCDQGEERQKLGVQEQETPSTTDNCYEQKGSLPAKIEKEEWPENF